jgi:pyridoxamine 5'-phosphate oxidase
MDLWTDLDDLHDWIWTELETAATDRKHALRTANIATAGFDEPRMRTVVLRGASRSMRHLAFHSDRRAEKIAELRANERIAWHWWNPDTSVQLRLRGHATIHTDDAVADQMWAAEPANSLDLYLKSQTPGTPADTPTDGLAEHVQEGDLTRDDVAPGRAHFAVIRSVIDHIDAVHLNREEHQRARFEWEESEKRWEKDWLIP